MKHPSRARLAATLAVLALAACATGPQRQTEWADPSLGANSRLLNGKVMIACDAADAADAALSRICEDALARELTGRGATPVTVPPGTALFSDRELDGQLVPSASSAGAMAVLVLTLAPAVADAGSSVSLRIGGFSFGRNSAVGIGLGVPIAVGTPSTGFAANGRVTDVRNGRMLWTSTFVARPSGDLRAQFSDLSRAIVDAAQGAGLL